MTSVVGFLLVSYRNMRVTNLDKKHYSSLLAALEFLMEMFEVLKYFLNISLKEELCEFFIAEKS